jgi:hypothetical protein
MQYPSPNEVERFARWAAVMSAAAQPGEHTHSVPEEDPERAQDNCAGDLRKARLDPTRYDQDPALAHPFLEAMRRYHTNQLRQYYQNRHYLRQRLRMQRASRRRSMRRGRSAAPLYQTERYAAWRGTGEAWILTNAGKPDPAWRKTPPIAGEMARRLLADLAAIDRELDEQGLEPAQVSEEGRLTWTIHLMEYEGYDLGLFEVRLSPEAGIVAKGGDYRYDGYSHPHLSRDGHLCTGRFGALRQWLYQDGALELVYTTASRILRTYNPESPYVKLEELVGGEELDECTRCGARLHEDESTVIGCEYYCSECIRWCDGCEEYVPLDCEGEYFRDQWYCASCAEEILDDCERCGARILKREAVAGGDGFTYCQNCVDTCEECQRAWPKAELVMITPAGGPERRVCLDCAEEFAQGREPESNPAQELLEQPA